MQDVLIIQGSDGRQYRSRPNSYNVTDQPTPHESVPTLSISDSEPRDLLRPKVVHRTSSARSRKRSSTINPPKAAANLLRPSLCLPTVTVNGKSKEKFCRSIRTVIVLLKWISSLNEKGESEGDGSGGRTFTDIASEAFTSDELKNSGLSFDLSQFKAKREVHISTEVKNILMLPSAARTHDQIQTALYGLQHLKSFAEYPLHMQEKLCNVAWFQQVPPRRIIIRQGHYAENFYFILSGTAVVRILDKNAKTGEVNLRTATIMRKGTSFGELALLHHSQRTATVVSQDTMQLLAIGRDDFFAIFMNQGRDGIPEHIKYISTMDFMIDWPLDILVKNPQHCLFHFFKRGVVIVQDSNQSDWLYIIKSGSCQVMKQLNSVLEDSHKSRSRKSENMYVKLPKLGTGEAVCKVDTGRGIASKFSHPRPSLVQQAFKTSGEEEDENSKIKSNGRTVRISESKPPQAKTPVFVQVDVLKPKDVFGLSTINLDDDLEFEQPSVSLVSNGAECIMLSRKFYTDHLNAFVKQRLRELSRPYPSDEALVENLRAKADWDSYKRRLLKHVITTNHKIKA